MYVANIYIFEFINLIIEKKMLGGGNNLNKL
jgi:hypothetical protein